MLFVCVPPEAGMEVHAAADVAELADALVSGTSGGNSMEVRLLSSAIRTCRRS